MFFRRLHSFVRLLCSWLFLRLRFFRTSVRRVILFVYLLLGFSFGLFCLFSHLIIQKTASLDLFAYVFGHSRCISKVIAWLKQLQSLNLGIVQTLLLQLVDEME